MTKELRWGARAALLAMLLVATALAAACSNEGPTGMRVKLPTEALLGFLTGPITWPTQPRTAEGEMLEVCKEFEGTPSGPGVQSANFTVTGTTTDGGGATSNEGPFAFSLTDGQCREVFASDIGEVSQLTVSEDASTTSGHNVTVQVITYNNGAISTGATVSATSANVTIGPTRGALVIFTNTVRPVAGCTRTLGYWKTHPEDWDQVGDPNTANFITSTTFFSSGQSYLQVLQTPPRGDAFYILAHQYIAARLNVGAGASTSPAVSAALAGAQAFFAGAPATRSQLIAWADVLAAFNEGGAGPEHCD